MRQLTNVNRTKVAISGCILLSSLGGAWLYSIYLVFKTISDITSFQKVIDINVYALWMPVGALGLVVIICAAFAISLYTGQKADVVWGSKGQSFCNFFIGICIVLGLVSAFATYQWMTGELERNGYVFSKDDSRFSAFGRHEVYLKTEPLR